MRIMGYGFPWGRRRHRRRDLHHVMFFWLMWVVCTMAVVVPLLMWMLAPDMAGSGHMEALSGFASESFAEVWQQPQDRVRLADRVSRHFKASVTLRDVDGTLLSQSGPPCRGPSHRLAVFQAGQELGTVDACVPQLAGRFRWVLGLLVVVGLLWMASGRVARRLSWPLTKLSKVAARIGDGELAARSGLRDHRVREVRSLAHSIDDMAARVQRQLDDQRELLAAVSHELRSPLARMRVALELAEERGGDMALITNLNEEVVASDKLIGDMLASARLDFRGVARSPVDLRELVGRLVERRGIDTRRLALAGEVVVQADATLLTRAVDNLLDNAERHGHGIERVSLCVRDGFACVDVEDGGPGFAEGALSRAFESFYRSAEGGVQGLGLGLSLVDRIASAHGGSVHAENRPSGGARVGFSIPLSGQG